MQQRVDVAVRAGGIHEDEGEAALVETDLVSARSLAEPGIRVDELLCLHFAGPFAGLRVDTLENLVDLLDKLVAVAVGLERRSVLRVHVQVPRAKAFEAHLLRALPVHFLLEGENELLDALVERLAVGRGVVEAVFREEDVVDKVLAVCVLRYLFAD